MSIRTVRIADLFCGAGGTSTGAVEAAAALGYTPELTAINHWDRAIATHSANHPGARHRCASLDSLNPRELYREGELDLLWASPECTHHSQARGGKPINEQSRATAMCVIRWAEALRPPVILIENVPEFETWGPIGSDRRPLKSRKGELFGAWKAMLEACGYTVDHRVFCAADYGDPTTRSRLIIQAVRGRRRIVWPSPTHAPADQCDQLFGALRPWRAAREIIQWEHRGSSIFQRKKPLSPNTIRRILDGFRTMGCQPFIINHSHGGSIHSIGKPLSTVCTERGGAYALVEPCLLPQGGGGALRPVSRPVPTVHCDGAIALIEPVIVKYYGTGIAKPVSLPVDAVTTKARFGLAEPIFTPDGGQIVDVLYRMLNVRELARAQGFHDTYRFTGIQEEVTKQIGNAVPRHLARALVAAALSQDPDVAWLRDREQAEATAVLN